MFTIKFMNIYNELVNFYEIIIQRSLVFKYNVQNIPHRMIFKKDIKISKKNSGILFDL